MYFRFADHFIHKMVKGLMTIHAFNLTNDHSKSQKVMKTLNLFWLRFQIQKRSLDLKIKILRVAHLDFELTIALVYWAFLRRFWFF